MPPPRCRYISATRRTCSRALPVRDADPAGKRTIATGSPAAAGPTSEYVPGTTGCGAAKRDGADCWANPAPPESWAAAISDGGAPNEGFPIRATDRALGPGRIASGGTLFGPAAGSTGAGGGGANCGGRETGSCVSADPASGAPGAPGIVADGGADGGAGVGVAVPAG